MQPRGAACRLRRQVHRQDEGAPQGSQDLDHRQRVQSGISVIDFRAGGEK